VLPHEQLADAGASDVLSWLWRRAVDEWREMPPAYDLTEEQWRTRQ
jgi:hypothetical protein